MIEGGRVEVTNLKSDTKAALEDAQQHIVSVGDIDKGIEPLRFCHWNTPEWGDQGQTAENTWYKAGLIAVALLNTAAQLAINLKRYEIAKEYAKLAKDRWNQFKNTYAPFELEMINEAANKPEYVEDYAGSRSRYSNWAKDAYNEANKRLAQEAKEYALCFSPSLVRDLALSGALAETDGINFGFRWEENQAIIDNDMRYSRWINLLALGRDLESQSAKYAKAADNIYGNLAGLAQDAASGAMGLLGYLSARKETTYPSGYSGTVGLSGDAGANYSMLYSGAALGPGAQVL